MFELTMVYKNYYSLNNYKFFKETDLLHTTSSQVKEKTLMDMNITLKYLTFNYSHETKLALKQFP